MRHFLLVLSQHTFSWRNKKKFNTYCLKCPYLRVSLTAHVNVMKNCIVINNLVDCYNDIVIGGVNSLIHIIG